MRKVEAVRGAFTNRRSSRTAGVQRNPWLEKSTAEQMGAFKEINILSGYRITTGYFKFKKRVQIITILRAYWPATWK